MAALQTVDPSILEIKTSFYYMSGEAFVDMLKVAECTSESLREIESGVLAMRRRLERAVEFERVENSKADIIKRMTDDLIRIELDHGMAQVSSGVRLLLSTTTTSESHTPTTDRGNRTNTGHATFAWTSLQDLQLLRIERNHPTENNAHFSGNPPRTKHAIRFRRSHLVKASTTIATLEVTPFQRHLRLR